MAMGVPKTTQIYVQTVSHLPLKGGPIHTETNRTSVFRGRGSGPSAPPPPSGFARALCDTNNCLECPWVCVAAINCSLLAAEYHK